MGDKSSDGHSSSLFFAMCGRAEWPKTLHFKISGSMMGVMQAMRHFLHFDDVAKAIKRSRTMQQVPLHGRLDIHWREHKYECSHCRRCATFNPSSKSVSILNINKQTIVLASKFDPSDMPYPLNEGRDPMVVLSQATHRLKPAVDTSSSYF